MTARTSRPISRYVVYFLVFALTALWMVPILTAVVTSLRTNSDILKRGFWVLPNALTLQNFVEAWNRGGLSHYLPNSFIITLPSLVLTLFFSSMAAYALARFRFRGDRLILFVFVAGMMLPFQILLLPVFKLMDTLHLYNTYWAVIIFHTAFQLGFCTFVLRNYMRTIPGEILEAARIDGCGEFKIYSRIMMPLTLPALAALATLEFTWLYNDFFWGNVLLQQGSEKPITSSISVLNGQYASDYNLIAAASMMIALPTLAVYLALQKQFISGLTLGANKG